jgi:hypothetical protein
MPFVPRRTAIRRALYPLAGFDQFGFDATLAHGPIDFPHPGRYGLRPGASEFVEATAAASDPATDLSMSNPRQTALRWRPTEELHARD